MELIGPDIALGLKGERIKEDSGFLRSIYQGREPQRGNRCGRRDESFQVESSVHYEIRSRIGGLAWASWADTTADSRGSDALQ